jgi:hypothetical protein
MAEDDPDQLKGPGGLTMRELHEQVQKSVARDKRTSGEAQKMRNQLAQKPSRWRRAFSFLLRYVQDRKRG